MVPSDNWIGPSSQSVIIGDAAHVIAGAAIVMEDSVALAWILSQI